MLATNEIKALLAEHYEGRHDLCSQANAGVRDFDLLLRASSHLVGYNRVTMGKSVSDQEVVCGLEEGIHGSTLVTGAGGPCADLAQGRQQPGVRFEEEPCIPVCSPVTQFVGNALKFIGH